MKLLIALTTLTLFTTAAPALADKPASLPEYRGAHYTKTAEAFLECVAHKESRWPAPSSWKSDGPYGSGAFQMIKATSARAAVAIGAPEWADKRAYLWPKYLQTEAAYWLANPLPKKPGLEGRHHWDPKHTMAVLGVKVKGCS